MDSPDLVIGYHKLVTEFFTGHVQHTTFRSDPSQGRRRVKVVRKWYRDRELGRGSFGTVFLERSERGDYRAVKDISKDRNSTIKIDYKRELMAMAVLAKHDGLFVQLFGWYESDDYVHIAMEYIRHGHLRNYLEVERSESEAKVITRQLLEGLVIIHQEGFAHRDLKPENIFVVTASPVWVKIGDFGLAKLVKEGTAFRTQAFTSGYFAPEAGIATGGDSSEYTNAVDIWAVGCIAHELLTRVLPFRNFFELSLYCTHPEFPRNYMLSKNISQKGIETVEGMLALHPERRITAKEALDSEWLRLEDEEQEGWETEEDSAGLASPEVSASLVSEVLNGDSLPGHSKEGFPDRVAIPVDVKDRRTIEVLLLELKHRLLVGFLSKDPIDEEMSELAKHFDMLESLGHIARGTMGVGEQAAIDSISLADVAALIRTTEITEVLGAIIELPLVPRDEEYQFRKRSTDLLQKWNELISPGDKNQSPTSASPAVKKEEGNQNGPISAQAPSASPAVEREKKDQSEFISTYTNIKEAIGNVWMAVAPQQIKSLAVNGPWAHARNSGEEDGNQNGPISAQVPSAPPAVEKEKGGQSGLISAHTSVKDAKKYLGMAVTHRRHAKSLSVNEPSTHERPSVDGQAEEASESRYPDAPNNPKPHANTDPDVKREPESIVERIQNWAESSVSWYPDASSNPKPHTNISRRQTKSLAVNEPSTHLKTSVDGQAEEASVSRYPDTLSNPKPHPNIDPDVKRVLELVLGEIQKSTNSPLKPMLSDKDAARMLLSGVISMDIRDSAGNTPLHVAVNRLRRFKVDVKTVPGLLRAFVASGADINAKNSQGDTPLFLAVSHDSSTATRELLELGASLEEPMFETPLHAAARLESDTICQLILRKGANVNIRDLRERTPLHKAVIHRCLVVAGSLISAGADVGARDVFQQTALGYAVVWNSVPLVELLLDHGANPDMVGKRGTSPRQEAVRTNAPGMIAMFNRAPVTR